MRIRLNLAESHVVEQMFDQLGSTLESTGDDAVQRRLYPAAYDDADAAGEFRELTEDGLRHDRTGRLAECLAELRAGRSMLRTEVVLDADATQRWLKVLNDLRLTYGVRLGISADDDNDLDERDPQVGMRARYLWLTALQDLLVTTVMG